MKSQARPRVWFNKTFSSIFNVLGLLRSSSSPLGVHLICSHTETDFLGFENADECSVEPKVWEEDLYLEWCLKFARENRVEIFVPGKHVAAVVKHGRLFDEGGTKVLAAADADQLGLLDDKAAFYESARSSGLRVPDFEKVDDLPGFERAQERLSRAGLKVCFKPNRSAGGVGFRVIDDSRNDFDNLLAGDATRISSGFCRSLLPVDKRFRDLLVMEYLPGPEYSIDCLAQHGRLLRAVVRRKPHRSGGAQLLEDAPDLWEIARRLAHQHALHFAFNIQIRMAGDSAPALLEINPRFSGGIHLAAFSGLNLPGWGLLLALDSSREHELPVPQTGIRVHQHHGAFPCTKSVVELP